MGTRKDIVVIDNGGATIKVGFAGDDKPVWCVARGGWETTLYHTLPNTRRALLPVHHHHPIETTSISTFPPRSYQYCKVTVLVSVVPNLFFFFLILTFTTSYPLLPPPTDDTNTRAN